MKKTLLTISASLLAMSLSYGQFGLTYKFDGDGTADECWNNGGSFANLVDPGHGPLSGAQSDGNFVLTSTSTGQKAQGYNVGGARLRLTYPVGEDCKSLVPIDMNTSDSVVFKAKADSPVRLRIQLASGDWGAATNGDDQVKEFEVTTEWKVFVADYEGLYGSYPADQTTALMWFVNVGDVDAETTGYDGKVYIDWLVLGDAAAALPADSFIVSSVKEINVSNEVSIAPNPAKESFNVDLSAFNGKSVAVRLMNSSGAIVREENAVNELTVNTDGLLKGIYMLQLVSDNKVANKKVVIE